MLAEGTCLPPGRHRPWVASPRNPESVMAAKLDRRTLIKGLAAATTAPFWPGCTPSVEPGPSPNPGTVRDTISHVVVVMMENRTFDHFLGSLSLVEGRTDINGLQAGMSNPLPDGTPVAIHLADRPCVADPPHSWNSSRGQWNDGAMDGFVREHVGRWGLGEADAPMQYWTRKHLSTLYTLADEYVTCDAWFASLLSSTWPNRFYSHAAQNLGMRGNDLPPGGSYAGMKTIYNSLDEAGVSWGCYHMTAPLMALLPQHWSAENFFPFDDFAKDARNGNLPQVTIVEPLYGRADDHPPAHPVAGQIFLSEVYDALAASPHWGNTQVFLTYDEHGGFFDHVAPPLLADDRAADGFDQAGPRVPALSIGPYVKRGEASHTVYDHTSMLAFIEALFELEPLTARDAAANDLFDTLDMARIEARNPRAPITLPTIVASEDELFAPECVYDLGRDAGDHGILAQPELEAWLDGLVMQHPTDNRDRIDDVYQAFLDRTEARGLWTRG